MIFIEEEILCQRSISLYVTAARRSFRAAHNQYLKVQSLFSGQFRAVSRDIVVHFLLGHDDLALDHETEHALPHHVLPGAFPELLQGQPLQAQPLGEVFLGETAAGFQLADFTIH